MDHISKSSKRRNSKSRARERIEKRKQRREMISSLANESLDKLPAVDLPRSSSKFAPVIDIILDAWWHFRRDAPTGLIVKGVGGLIIVLLGFFTLMTLFSPNIGPNISTMGIALSGQSVDEATQTLFQYWNDDVSIDLLVNGEVFAQVIPSEIGLTLDASATAQAAKDAGLSGFPFGQEITPIITAEYSDIQTYMLSIANAIYIPAYEAGYEWRDGTLVSVTGQGSRELDVVQSVQRIVDDPETIVQAGSVEVVTTSTPPRVIEADPYYDEAVAFVTSDFVIEGYDPFRDENQLWATTRQEMARWLVVTENGLQVREDSLDSFVNQVNSQLDVENWTRYLDPQETYDAINNAFVNGTDIADVRIRYADSTYTLRDGDWGFRLSRRLGLPFFNIQNVNPGINWEEVYPGERIAVPSRDLVIPLDPVENRRIVVDLDRRYLVAFENDEIVFDWPISVGRTDAPTNPGVYQILSQVDVASGSSFALCNDNAECGQWEMDHFMGIYEVGVGLTNGFHGTVRLPNGNTLTQGSAQLASTFGCVMSDSHQAEMLYNWAETGIVVEMISSDFPPESETGQRALEFIQNRA
ncbi:MAG: L,D-transpeptidase family protein [Anaerolineae bacterium]